MHENARLHVVFRSVYGGRNGFAHIASALESRLKGKVKLHIIERDPSTLITGLKYKGRKVAIFYGLSTPAFLELAPELARVSKLAPTVVGGPHASGAYWQVLRLGAVASVVGDGEIAAPEIAELLVEDGVETLVNSYIHNTAFHADGKFRVGATLLADLDSTSPHHPPLSLYPPIEIMRGCTYRCKFCQVPWQFKSTVRFRSVQSVARAVSDYIAVGKYRIRFIAPIGFAYGSHDLEKPNPGAIEELLTTVRALGGRPYLGSFPSETRPEFVTNEVLKIVKRLAYNKRISIGMQSGSDELLSMVNRGHYAEEAWNASYLALKEGFTPVVDIIFGLPGEDDTSIEETIDYMFRLASIGARLRLHTFLPLVGTPLARYKPRPVDPRYRKAVLKLLGKGVIEGFWEDQEGLGKKMYCLTALDPAPTSEPRPLANAVGYCRDVWLSEPVFALEPYRRLVKSMLDATS